MTDVLPQIAEMLGEIADVELAYHDGFTKRPCIILSETGNASSVILSGKERYSIITVQADIYAENEADVRELAISADGILAAKNIKRSFSQFITDEEKPRMCMRYRFGLDNVTGRVVSV